MSAPPKIAAWNSHDFASGFVQHLSQLKAAVIQVENSSKSEVRATASSTWAIVGVILLLLHGKSQTFYCKFISFTCSSSSLTGQFLKCDLWKHLSVRSPRLLDGERGAVGKEASNRHALIHSSIPVPCWFLLPRLNGVRRCVPVALQPFTQGRHISPCGATWVDGEAL